MEGYGIYKVVRPELFGSANRFMRTYCMIQMQRLRNGRKVPTVVGYMPEQLRAFRDKIAPFYLGRAKHEVAKELPSLSTRTIETTLTKAQEDKYYEALEGLLTVGEASGETEVREVDKLTAVTYCQQIVNHLGLIDCEGPSSKLTSLLELLTEGDFADAKVIVFTRFKKMVDILIPELEAKGIGATRITGDENDKQRQEAKEAFQDPNSDTRVICITMAGSDAINLQTANALIFYDAPFTAGDYIQIIGRMIRIGSDNDKCYAIHLLTRCKRRRTIDSRVMEILEGKMNLVEAVLGARLKGEDTDESAVIESQSDVLSQLFDGLLEDASS